MHVIILRMYAILIRNTKLVTAKFSYSLTYKTLATAIQIDSRSDVEVNVLGFDGTFVLKVTLRIPQPAARTATKRNTKQRSG